MPSAAVKGVFISYSRVNGEIVTIAAKLLKAGGATVFQDVVDIEYGANWQDALAAAIRRCERVLVFWSVAASTSEWVEREWRAALEAGKRIVPMLLDKTPLPNELSRFNGMPELMQLLLLVRKSPAALPSVVGTDLTVDAEDAVVLLAGRPVLPPSPPDTRTALRQAPSAPLPRAPGPTQQPGLPSPPAASRSGRALVWAAMGVAAGAVVVGVLTFSMMPRSANRLPAVVARPVPPPSVAASSPAWPASLPVPIPSPAPSPSAVVARPGPSPASSPVGLPPAGQANALVGTGWFWPMVVALAVLAAAVLSVWRRRAAASEDDDSAAPTVDATTPAPAPPPQADPESGLMLDVARRFTQRLFD